MLDNNKKKIKKKEPIKFMKLKIYKYIYIYPFFQYYKIRTSAISFFYILIIKRLTYFF